MTRPSALARAFLASAQDPGRAKRAAKRGYNGYERVFFADIELRCVQAATVGLREQDLPADVDPRDLKVKQK